MQQQALQNVNALTRALITEATPLNNPPDATTDEDNCTLSIKGERTRRLGIDFETGYNANTYPLVAATHDFGWFDEHIWRSVGGDGGKNFLVIHVYDKLYFLDTSSEPVSANLKDFSVNLSAYTNSTSSSAEDSPVQVASGRGYLFVVGEDINPIRIEYHADTDTISVTEIAIEIRDFDGVGDGEDVDERPTSLTATHQYNLENQGWAENIKHDGGGSTRKKAHEWWDTHRSDFPSNADIWWLWREADSEVDFRDSRTGQELSTGNSAAPKGHFILNPFYKDRATVSGISGLAIEQSPDASPSSVVFYAGRVFYAGKQGDLLYSQIIDDVKNAGKCYSINDPTSEENPDLIATDGGVIVIPDAGHIIALRVIGHNLIVLANNGCWQVNGREGVFKADDFFVQRISDIGAMSARTIVDVNGSIIWWNEFGIYTLQQAEVSQAFKTVSLSEQTIQTFYDNIPTLSKYYAKGAYDAEKRKVYWVYRTTAPTTEGERFRYDGILVLDTRFSAFMPWSVSSIAGNTPEITGVTYIPIFGTASTTEAVTDENGDPVLDQNSDPVTVEALDRTSLTNGLKFVTIMPSSELYDWTLSEANSEEYVDWYTFDLTGAGYTSYFETGNVIDEIFPRRKEAQEVIWFLGAEADSSAFMTAYWDFANAADSGKYSTTQQIYRDNTITARSKTRQQGRSTVASALRVNGSGRTFKLRVESESGKPFNIFGWSVVSRSNPRN